MKIRTGIESVDETTIAGKFCEYPQLDLRIVGNDQLPSIRITTEASPVLDRVWHLLDVRISARKPAGRRAYLPEIRVQTFRYGIDHFDHIRAVTRECLLNRAIYKQRSDNRILGR